MTHDIAHIALCYEYELWFQKQNLTCPYQQGQDVGDTCFVLRAVQGCYKKRLPRYYSRTMY